MKEMHDEVDIVLVDAGLNRLKVLKSITDTIGVDFATAKSYIDNVPCTIKFSIIKEEAENIVQQLEENGAVLEIVSNENFSMDVSQTSQESYSTDKTPSLQIESKNREDINLLKCKMCGSTDLEKQNDIFICQSCSTKYSVSEAQNMVIEGAIKVDKSHEVDNYYILAEQNFRAGVLNKAIEYCDKMLEINPNNYNGWKLKCKIEYSSWLKLASDTSINFTPFNPNNNLEYEKRDAARKNLSDINSRAIKFIKTAFSCANDLEKKELLKYVIDISTIYLNLLKKISFDFSARVDCFINQPHTSMLRFVISNYNEQDSALFIEHYSREIIKSIDSLLKRGGSGTQFDNRYMLCFRILKSMIDNMGNDKFVNIKKELIERSNELENSSKIKSTEDKLKNLVEDLRDDLKWAQEKNDSYWIQVFNDKKEELRSVYNSNINISKELKKEINELLNTEVEVKVNTKKGCYVATCVYGSYDCPEVWTLRRFRDYTLVESWYGRLFINTYYAISPTLVKLFGNSNCFKSFWKNILDRMVDSLNKCGYKNTKYDDKM